MIYLIISRFIGIFITESEVRAKSIVLGLRTVGDRNRVDIFDVVKLEDTCFACDL